MNLSFLKSSIGPSNSDNKINAEDIDDVKTINK